MKTNLSLILISVLATGCSTFSVEPECPLGQSSNNPNCIGVTTAYTEAVNSKVHPDSETARGEYISKENKDNGLFSKLGSLFGGSEKKEASPKDGRIVPGIATQGGFVGNKPYFEGGAFPDTHKGLTQPEGSPVYIPPSPKRVWIAPWTDDNGILHAGEWVYFETPGQWSLGTLNKKGAAGMFEPTKPRSTEEKEKPAPVKETAPEAPKVTEPVLPPQE